MPAVKASKTIQHSMSDRKRMEVAQASILEALKHSGVQAPRILGEGPPPPPANIAHGCVVAADGGATPAAAAGRGASRGMSASVSTSLVASSLPSTPLLGASRPRGVPPIATAHGTPPPPIPGAPPPPIELPATSDGHPPARPASPARGGARGGRTPDVLPSGRPATVGGYERAAGRLTLTSTASSGAHHPSTPFVAASPSNLAPDNTPPVDPAEQARERAARRARALWNGLELLIYGASGTYERALHALFRKEDEERRNRSVAAKAYTVMAVGGQLDAETLVSLAVRTMQRNFKRKRAARLEARSRKAEHTATLAILSVHSSAFGKLDMSQGSRRRGREHMALIERVAAARILAAFRSLTYTGNRDFRKRNCLEMQARARRYLAFRRVKRFRLKEREEERKNVMATIAITNAEKYARSIQAIFKAHQQTNLAKLEAFNSQAAAFPSALRAELSASPGGLAVLAAAVSAERHAVMLRRDAAIRAGALKGAGPSSSRPMPLTREVNDATIDWLRDALLAAVRGAQTKSDPAAPASVLQWATALEARSRLEGALCTMRTLEEAWPQFMPVLGQVSIAEQQLRAPPPPPPKGVPPDAPSVAEAVDALDKFARASGAASVVDSFQAARYAELLERLALQRQEALKVSLRLEFCHQLKGMRKRHALVRLCQQEVAEVAAFVPITVHTAFVRVMVRADDWKGVHSPELDTAAAATLCQELRDWYGVSKELALSATVERVEEKNVLWVRVDIYSADSGRDAPPTAALQASIQDVLDRFEETPARTEKSRLPDLAALWDCTYIGFEVLQASVGKTEVHDEPSLAQRIAEARAAFGDAQRSLDAIGATNRVQKWTNVRKWHFIEGAASWLKGETTPELGVAIGDDVASAMPTAAQAFDKKVASRMRWEAVKQLALVQKEQAHADRIKKLKQVAVRGQQQAAAKELLAAMLLEATYAQLPDWQWRTEGCLDTRWNIGLVGGPAEAEADDGVLDHREVLALSAKVEYELKSTKPPVEMADVVPVEIASKQSPADSDYGSPSAARSPSSAARSPSVHSPRVPPAATEATTLDDLQPAWATGAWDKSKSGAAAEPEQHLQVRLALSTRPLPSGNAPEPLGGRHPEAAEGKPLSKNCYYCAGGRGGPHRPFSSAHPMCDCKLRKQHGCREYPPEALRLVRKTLDDEEAILNRAIAEQAANAIEAKLSRKGSYQLGGVSSVVQQARARHMHVDADALVPPPPLADSPRNDKSYLGWKKHKLEHDRTFWESILVNEIAKAARVSGYPRLSDFKGLAVLQTLPPAPVDLSALGAQTSGPSPPTGLAAMRGKATAATAAASTPTAPPPPPPPPRIATPLRVLEAAEDLGLLYGLIGSVQGLGGPAPGHTTRAAPFKCIWIATAYSLAPLPAMWVEKRVAGKSVGEPSRAVWHKADHGILIERETHPLRDAYRSTCARCVRHCPDLSLKQRPYLAWLLFSIDGKPRCVDMRHAAKRAYKHKSARAAQAQRAPSRLKLGLDSGMKKLLPPKESQTGLLKLSDEQQRSEGAGLNFCTFPPLKPSSVLWAPLPKVELNAQMLAATACAAIEHAAGEAALKRQEARRVRLLAEAELEARKAVRFVASFAVLGDATVRVRLVPCAPGSHPPPVKVNRSSSLSEASRARQEAEQRLCAKSEADALEIGVCVYEHVDQLRVQFDSQRAHSLQSAPRALEEVLVMASYLGLSYGGDTGVEHLWIADAALCPQIPLGWVRHVEPDTETPFYQNVWNGEKMWEHPQVAFLRGCVAAINKAADSARKASPMAATILSERQFEKRAGE